VDAARGLPGPFDGWMRSCSDLYIQLSHYIS